MERLHGLEDHIESICTDELYLSANRCSKVTKREESNISNISWTTLFSLTLGVLDTKIGGKRDSWSVEWIVLAVTWMQSFEEFVNRIRIHSSYRAMNRRINDHVHVDINVGILPFSAEPVIEIGHQI